MSRFAGYKNHGKDMENLRSKRKEVTIELRKSKREGQLAKKRNLNVEEDTEDQTMDAVAIDSNAMLPDSTSMDIETLPGFLATLMEEISEPVSTVSALKGIRKLLSQDGKPPIAFMIEAGVIPTLIKFLHPQAGEGMQYEATWALTNIASGDSEHTLAVVRAGAVPKLVALLSSTNEEVQHQAVWAIGNIAGDGFETRDLVLEAGAMPLVISLIRQNMNVRHLRNIVWTICNLCRGKNPPPNFEQVKLCLPILNMALQCPDLEVKVDASWALSYLTDGSNEKIQAVLDQGIVPNLVQMLASEHIKQLVPAIRAVGNIVSGNDAQTDTVIEAGGLSRLIHILANQNHHIVKEATWALSNITAGNAKQIQAALSAGLMIPLKNVLEKGEVKCKKEAAWVVTNLTCAENNAYISVLMEMGFIPLVCNLLDCFDIKTMMVVLEGIYNILKIGERYGCLPQYAFVIEECGGLDKIEALQQHTNTQLYGKACDIIDHFFQAEGEADEAAASLDTFQFSGYEESNEMHHFNF